MPKPIPTVNFLHHLYDDLLGNPEQAFSRALRCIERHVGADGGLAQLRDMRTGEMLPLASNNYPESAQQAYAEHFASVDPWQQLFTSDQISTGVHRSDDIIKRRRLQSTEFYNDYWQPLGFGDAIGIFGRVGKHHAYTFGLPRLRVHGLYTEQHKQMLQPYCQHLHNAVALTLEMQLQKRRAQIHNPLTEHLPLAIFLVDQQLQLLDENQLADELLAAAKMFTVANGKLIYHHAGVQARLLNALQACQPRRPDGPELPTHVLAGQCRGDHLPAHNIYLLPQFEGCLLSFQLVVALADQQLADADMTAVLMTLFDLTLAEAQVATCLFNGRNPAAIAVLRGVSVATVRAQLKSAMAKAQCHSQVELIRSISQLVIAFR